MESHEVIRNTFEKSSPKEIAAELGVSLSLVYKWAEPKEGKGSGSRNPLDRVAALLAVTRDPQLIHWICNQAGGYYVRNPESLCDDDFEVMPATNEIVGMFSRLLTVIAQAAEDEIITDEESEQIRQVWEKLKSYTEGFVTCCEEGDFAGLEASEEGARLIPR